MNFDEMRKTIEAFGRAPSYDLGLVSPAMARAAWPDAEVERVVSGGRLGVGDIQIRVMDLPKAREQVRYPRSKRKRIRKKWAGDPRNFREVDVAYLVDTSRFKVLEMAPLRLEFDPPRSLATWAMNARLLVGWSAPEGAFSPLKIPAS